MGTHPIFESDFDCLTDGMLPLNLGARVSILEELILVALVAQCAVWLDGDVGFVVATFISLMSVADWFPVEDGRYFESARQRASSGFAICTLAVHLLHAAILLRVGDGDGISSVNERVHLGFAYAAALCFAITQLMFSTLFSGIFVPIAISLALLLLPAVISAQVFGVLEVYDFDDNVEVALFVFAILGLMHALQSTLKQSFTVGESYLVSSLLISSLYAAWSYCDHVVTEHTVIIVCFGVSASLATACMLYTGHATRVDRNSSPHLTRADVRLSLVFHASVIFTPLGATIVHLILGLDSAPPVLLLARHALDAFLDPHHLILLLWGVCLMAAAVKLAVGHKSKQQKEMSTQKRKTFHFVAVAAFVPAMFVNIASLAIVSFGAFWTMLWLSIYSSHQIYPYGGYLRRLSASITDYRDGGKIVLTPVYLLFGLASPIWLDLLRFGHLRLSSSAGLVAIGIGDSVASIIGRKYGRNRWFRDGKSLEGMFANFAAQLACLSALRFTDVDATTSNSLTLAKLIACAFLSALLEAATDQIDNFVLPLISYSMLSLAME